jgi:hypothetical protein
MLKRPLPFRQRSTIRRWNHLAIAAFAVFASGFSYADNFADVERINPPLMMLVAKLATPLDGASNEYKQGLVASFESAYGNIQEVPTAWPTLVRRTLVCQAVADHSCVQSSLASLDKQGPVASLPFKRLYEVSRMKMDPATLIDRIQNARLEAEAALAPKAASPAQPDKAASVAVDASAAQGLEPVAATPMPEPVAAAPVPAPVAATAAATPAPATMAAPSHWLLAALRDYFVYGAIGALLLTVLLIILFPVYMRSRTRKMANALHAERDAAEFLANAAKAAAEEESEALRLKLKEAEEDSENLRREAIENETRLKAELSLANKNEQSALEDAARLVNARRQEEAARAAADLAEKNRVAEEQRQKELALAAQAKHAEEQLAIRSKDQLLNSARTLLDAMHKATLDVEPFMNYMGDTPKSEAFSGHLAVLKNWYDAVKTARNNFVDTFKKNNWQVELMPIEPSLSMTESMGRLMEHASFFCTILQLQGKTGSAVYHWSRMLPGALVHMYWTNQTASTAKSLEGKPMVDLPVDKAPVTLNDSMANPDSFFKKAVEQAKQQSSPILAKQLAA